MTKKQLFIRKPIPLEAYQWFKNGNHPLDNVLPTVGPRGKLWYSEGKVVKYYKVQDGLGLNKCQHCNNIMNHHGWIATLEGGHIVCPGDWIVQGVKKEFWPVKPDIFEITYEKVLDVQ